MTFLPKKDLLSLEELDRLCSAFIEQGRAQAAHHRRRAAGPQGHHDAVPRARPASRSRRARGTDADDQRQPAAEICRRTPRRGVHRINVSLDTLDPTASKRSPAGASLADVMRGVDSGRGRRPQDQVQRRCLEGRQRRRNRGSGPLRPRPRRRSDADRDHAARRYRRRSHRSIPAALDRAGAADGSLHARRQPLSNRRPGALCDGEGNGRPARFHHADDAQFLRKLQPRAADLHRVRCSCASARKTLPICATPLRAKRR